MLTDITLFSRPDPVAQVLRMINGGVRTKRLQRGVYLCGHWNFDREVAEPLVQFWKRNEPPFMLELPQTLHKKWPVRPHDNSWEQVDSLSEYGVCDSPEQLLSLYDFDADPRKLVISMVEVRREHQPPEGGWRWHKWGSYIGEQNPEHEYLYYDKHIDRVFTFHIYEIGEDSH